jgi:Rps23 Pro-64 3,4-dihydroxylase Tpa1-like proline 4-hydroxylase
VCQEFIDAAAADALLAWLEGRPWCSVGLDGYDGYCDMPLTASNLPEALSGFVAPGFLMQLRQIMAQFFAIDSSGHVRVTAHRILTGGALSPHTDVSHLRFTHRLLVQLNREWKPEYGGVLCLHAGSAHADQDSLRKTVPPLYRSGFAFEISPRSFHSVTPVLHGERYTLSYTFYPPANGVGGVKS